MSTSIPVKNVTVERLDRLRVIFEKKHDRKLSFDEVLNLLMEMVDGSMDRKSKAMSELFGILTPDPSALKSLRREEEKRLENFSRRHG